MDWKFIFCGAWEKPKMGNKINNIILEYMILDFYVLSRTNARLNIKMTKNTRLITVPKWMISLGNGVKKPD
jgi:hypothetical protein